MLYTCGKCGWVGEVKSRPRCLVCYAKRVSEWRANNPDKAKAQKARYQKRHRETRRDEHNARRRRLRKSETNAANYRQRLLWLIQGDATRQDLISIYEKAKGLCVYCGIKVRPRFTPTDPRGFDHVIARVNGGKHTASNIVVSCGRCNARKGVSDSGTHKNTVGSTRA